MRWTNYTAASDTWEPADNLQDCEDIIENYMKTMDEKPKVTSVTLYCNMFVLS